MCKERVKELGKNTVIQLSIGTVGILVYTTWRANDLLSHGEAVGLLIPPVDAKAWGNSVKLREEQGMILS